MKIHLKGKAATNEVWLNGKKLNLNNSLKVRNHSPTGFNWGYGGSGPAQTALAICIELFGRKIAGEVYQNFKFAHVSALPFEQDFDQVIEFELEDIKNKYE